MTRVDCDAQHRQEGNSNVKQHDVDMNKDERENKVQWKRRATPLSMSTERDKMMMSQIARGRDYHSWPHLISNRDAQKC